MKATLSDYVREFGRQFYKSLRDSTVLLFLFAAFIFYNADYFTLDPGGTVTTFPERLFLWALLYLGLATVVNGGLALILTLVGRSSLAIRYANLSMLLFMALLVGILVLCLVLYIR